MTNYWNPAGPVSRLSLPPNCDQVGVQAVWIPVHDTSPVDELPDLSQVPLVNQSEASTFVIPKRAHEHAAGRYALARLLQENGLDPNELQIIRDENRKPSLIWNDNHVDTPLPEITIGHSGGIAIAAISIDGTQIGLDAEPLEHPRQRNLLPMMASGVEYQYLNDIWDLDAEIGMQEATRTWVMKEAVQKACGYGMQIPPLSFNVLNKDEVELSHDGQGFRLTTHHWLEHLMGQSFAFGFSRMLGSEAGSPLRAH
ncbi:MAG: 4'-phosphopantetheinyl transferase superfamily protein [Candidatus Thermoplasmatota archaeon]|nr:4'-phosphopantetheinyl transferase superfamily protein [Candidatus Thermoplasmatota archaeon]